MTDHHVTSGTSGAGPTSAATQTATGAPSGSPTPVEAAGNRFTAAMYDPFLWLGERLGMQARRRGLLSSAHGHVLEIGAGTGLNLRNYPAGIEELVLTEPSGPMAERLGARQSTVGGAAQIVAAPAEALPFEDESFNTVVSTLVLCTVPDPERALAEVRRVLRPGGRLLFCEHVRSASPRLARWQDRSADMWAAFADGCRCNRPTLEAISRTFEIATIERARWQGMPPIVQPLVVGEAVCAGRSTHSG
jgi:SAM-dependent methyltransferase